MPSETPKDRPELKREWQPPKLEELAPDVIGALQIADQLKHKLLTLDDLLAAQGPRIDTNAFRRQLLAVHHGLDGLTERLTQPKE